MRLEDVLVLEWRSDEVVDMMTLYGYLYSRLLRGTPLLGASGTGLDRLSLPLRRAGSFSHLYDIHLPNGGMSQAAWRMPRWTPRPYLYLSSHTGQLPASWRSEPLFPCQGSAELAESRVLAR